MTPGAGHCPIPQEGTQTHRVCGTVGRMLVICRLVPAVGGNTVVHEPAMEQGGKHMKEWEDWESPFGGQGTTYTHPIAPASVPGLIAAGEAMPCSLGNFLLFLFWFSLPEVSDCSWRAEERIDFPHQINAHGAIKSCASSPLPGRWCCTGSKFNVHP